MTQLRGAHEIAEIGNIGFCVRGRLAQRRRRDQRRQEQREADVMTLHLPPPIVSHSPRRLRAALRVRLQRPRHFVYRRLRRYSRNTLRAVPWQTLARASSEIGAELDELGRDIAVLVGVVDGEHHAVFAERGERASERSVRTNARRRDENVIADDVRGRPLDRLVAGLRRASGCRAATGDRAGSRPCGRGSASPWDSDRTRRRTPGATRASRSPPSRPRSRPRSSRWPANMCGASKGSRGCR